MAHLAHEMNSLLDGSIRFLEMAQLELGADLDPDSSAARAISLVRRAEDGLWRLARLLERAMAQPSAGLEIFDEREPLHEQVQRIVQTVEPMAQRHSVEVTVDLTPRAKSLPASTLGPVILNGLRNAIEACTATEMDERRVELSVFVDQTDRLIILIADTGSGPADGDEPSPGVTTKPSGHGFGLDLSRRIIKQLGGELRLTSVPFGPGAILQAAIPLRSLAVDE